VELVYGVGHARDRRRAGDHAPRAVLERKDRRLEDHPDVLVDESRGTRGEGDGLAHPDVRRRAVAVGDRVGPRARLIEQLDAHVDQRRTGVRADDEGLDTVPREDTRNDRDQHGGTQRAEHGQGCVADTGVCRVSAQQCEQHRHEGDDPEWWQSAHAKDCRGGAGRLSKKVEGTRH